MFVVTSAGCSDNVAVSGAPYCLYCCVSGVGKDHFFDLFKDRIIVFVLGSGDQGICIASPFRVVSRCWNVAKDAIVLAALFAKCSQCILKVILLSKIFQMLVYHYGAVLNL